MNKLNKLKQWRDELLCNKKDGINERDKLNTAFGNTHAVVVIFYDQEKLDLLTWAIAQAEKLDKVREWASVMPDRIVSALMPILNEEGDGNE
jgi:hypothetical protein